jgi:hypothetical protein
MDCKGFIGKFSSIIIVLTSVGLGLLVPDIGLLWHPYTSVFLALIMFFVALNIEPKEFISSIKSYKIILLAFGLVFIVPPIFSVIGLPFFKPIEYAALVIALGSPAAISSVFWCDVFEGHTPLALSDTNNSSNRFNSNFSKSTFHFGGASGSRASIKKTITAKNPKNQYSQSSYPACTPIIPYMGGYITRDHSHKGKPY